MTTKAVAVVEDEGTEVVEADQLSKKDATALNRKIKTVSEKVAENAYNLLDLLEQASVGSIHKALGYKSWTEWYSENVQIQVEDANERKALATMMSGKGMSQRAIAASLGVGQATVSRDLEGSGDSDESGGTTTGLDGKEYKKKAKGDEPEVIDGEVVDEGEVVVAEKRATLASLVKTAVEDLHAAATALFELATEDERFAKGRKTIRKNHEETLTDAFNGLADVFDILEIEIAEPEEAEEEEAEEAEEEAAEEDSTEEAEDADEDEDEDDDDF